MSRVYLQHLSKTSHDVVKRWVNEAQEAVNSDNVMVQVRFLWIFLVASQKKIVLKYSLPKPASV